MMSRGDRNTLSGRGRATPDVRLPYCPTVTVSCLLQAVNKGRRAVRVNPPRAIVLWLVEHYKTYIVVL